MSITVEVELKEILGQINNKLDNVQKDVTDIKLELTGLKGEIKRLDDKIDNVGKRLDDKIDGLGKRLDNQEFISRGILVALIVAILGGLAKLFGLVGNS